MNSTKKNNNNKKVSSALISSTSAPPLPLHTHTSSSPPLEYRIIIYECTRVHGHRGISERTDRDLLIGFLSARLHSFTARVSNLRAAGRFRSVGLFRPARRVNGRFDRPFARGGGERVRIFDNPFTVGNGNFTGGTVGLYLSSSRQTSRSKTVSR